MLTHAGVSDVEGYFVCAYKTALELSVSISHALTCKGRDWSWEAKHMQLES